MITNKEINLYGEEQGLIKNYKTCWEAYKGLKEIKESDKELRIVDIYYFMFEYDKDNKHYMQELKIYKRKNKLYYKFI